MTVEWKPIESYEDGTYVLFWLPIGEKGVPTVESAMAFRTEAGMLDPWTNGGPNSGSDYDFTSQPTHWALCPLGPNGEMVHMDPRCFNRP